jgi:hypothetical protein
MEAANKINLLLALCIVLISVLLYKLPDEPNKLLVSWDQLDLLVQSEIRNFPYQPDRVRIREVAVNENLTRRVTTLNVNQDYPQTRFHMQISDAVKPFGGYTYAMVSIPDKMTTIHIKFSGTITRTIVFLPEED